MKAISEQLERLTAPQDEVDRLRNLAVRHGGRAFSDLAYANAYDGPKPEAIDAIRRALQDTAALALQYTPYGGSTVARRLVAEALRDSHQMPFALGDVVLTPGAMAALNIAFRSVRSDPGDEVVVITPCWLDYPLYLENLGLVARLVPVNSELRLDIDAIRAALTPKTKAVILSQPANPAGLLYGEEELRSLASALEDSSSKPLLISDECHRDIVFGENRFGSPVQHYPNSVVIYSVGKVLALQGQRLGYIAVSPKHPRREAYAQELIKLTRIMGFCTPTALMQLALGDLLQIRGPIATTARKRDRTLEVLRRAGYKVVASQATFFLYPQAPGGDATAFTEYLARKGVMILPASVFHHHGHFRISLTASDEMLDRGLEVLEQVLPEYMETLR